MLPFILFIAFSLEFHFLKNNMQWQHTLMISQSLWVRITGMVQWGSSGTESLRRLQSRCPLSVSDRLQSVSGGCSLISRLSWNRIHSKLTHMVVGRIRFFVGCWTEGLGSLPGGSLHQKTRTERECKQNRSHTLSHPHYESDIPSLLPQSIHYKQFVRANTHPRGGNQIREKIPGGEAQLGAILEAACHSWVQHFQLTVLFSQHSVDGIPVFSSFLCPR